MPFLSWSSHQRQVSALARFSQSQGLLLLCRELLGTAQLCLGELSKVAPGARAAPGAGHTLCSPKPEALAEEEEGRKGQSSRFCLLHSAPGKGSGRGTGRAGRAEPSNSPSWALLDSLGCTSRAVPGPSITLELPELGKGESRGWQG